MNTDSYSIRLKELPLSTVFAAIITSKVFLLTLSLIASESRWIFSYVLATIAGLALLHFITKIFPICYLLKITSKEISYVTVFRKIKIPWDDFQFSRIEWHPTYGKNACMYDNSQRLKVRFLGAVGFNCYLVGDLVNFLKQNYSEGKLKNDAELKLLMADFLTSSKKDIQALLETSQVLIKNATQLNSVVAINKDWFILRFGDFPLRFFSIILVLFVLYLIPMPMVSAFSQDHHLWKFISYVLMLLVVTCLVFLAFMVKNNVFYNANTREAHRIISIFKYYFLKGGKINSVTTMEIFKSSVTKNTYGIFLKNAFDRILCKSYLMIVQSRSLAKKLSEAIQLPINDPFAKKLTHSLILYFDFCNFFTMITLPVVLILIHNKPLIIMVIHAINGQSI